jgi:hypothetical protein
MPTQTDKKIKLPETKENTVKPIFKKSWADYSDDEEEETLVLEPSNSSVKKFDKCYVWLLMKGDDYTPGVYTSVHSINRTKFWKKNLETAIKIDEKYKIFSIGEMIFEYLMLLDGKVFKFDDIFWYRSMENSPIPASKIKFSIWWEKLKIIEKKNFVFELFAKKTIIKKTIKIFDKLSYYLKTRKREKPSLLRRVIFKLFNITYVKMHKKNQILKIIKNNKILINLEELELIENYIAK